MADEQQDIEYEEIDSDEVDRVVAALEQLMESVQSETIQSYLAEAVDSIFYLVYEDGEETETGAAA